jgi:release factor H-coupled RctB family protein
VTPEEPRPEAATVRVIASPSSWIEGEALRQLEAAARLPGMRLAVGLPDLHPGRGHPIGAAFASEGFVHPHLVGGDIGCGMALFRTGLSARKAKRDAWAKRLAGLEEPWDGDAAQVLAEHGASAGAFEPALGTIGGGNHFAELQVIHEVGDEEAIARLGLDASELVLLVHSGSRGLGQSILDRHVRAHGAGALPVPSPEAAAYLEAHDEAVRWAHANRALVARRFLDLVGGEPRVVLDVCHNSVTPRGGGLLHRKGAAPHDRGVVAVPGSRGSYTYLVEPVGDGERSGWSLAHGAGRKYTRGDARKRLRERFRASELRQTELGSVVLCDDKDLLFEEAPAAYKDVDRVVQDLVDGGVGRVVAVTRPLITYKVRARE